MLPFEVGQYHEQRKTEKSKGIVSPVAQQQKSHGSILWPLISMLLVLVTILVCDQAAGARIV